MNRVSVLATVSSVVVLAAGLLVAVPTPAYAASSDYAWSSDSDRDGMPTRWEVRFHLNAHRADAFADADHDGLTNIAEFRLGTSPRDADSDNDGRSDGLEDRDHDGLDNEDEAVNDCGIGGVGDEDECLVGAFAAAEQDD